MKISASLFVTIKPIKAFMVWGGKNKKEAYSLARKVPNIMKNTFTKKSKYYYISPVRLEVSQEKCPELTFYTPILERHPGVMYVFRVFRVHINDLMRNIMLFNQYRYLGKINYIEEYAHLKVYNLRKEYGIMRRHLFCNKHYKKKKEELVILLSLNRYFKNWLLVQLIHSFLPPNTEVFDLDLEIFRI